MTTTLTPPSGLTPTLLTSWNRYFIPQSDTSAYRVGDAVKSAGGTDAAGIIAVTLHSGTGPARGVIVAVDPGLPATGGLVDGQKRSVPAAKLTGYYVWVDDDPSHQFAMVDDGLTPANSVASSAGKYANFTPGAVAAANGGSTAAITSSSLGSSSGCLQVLSLQPGSAYGAAATWLVKFAVHELANNNGQGGGGISTLASASDYTANLVTPLAAKQNVPINWNGTTPALVSSTNPVPAFGSNAFLYTGAGGAVLDGNTYQTGDVALWNGTVFVKEIYGGGYLGSFAAPALLQTACPAASNPACIALVGGVIYISNGTTWLTKAAVPTGVSGPTTLNDGHDCANLLCTSTPAVTVNTGLKNGFGCSIKGAFTTAGTATITDLRATTGTAFCCLVQSDAAGTGLTYDLVGTK